MVKKQLKRERDKRTPIKKGYGARLIAVGIGALFFGMALFSEHAVALGLGPLSLYSYINEPLDADIELLDVGAQPLEGITVNLATEQDFKQFRMERPFILSTLNFELVRLGQKTFIRVRSEVPIKQSYLNVLLELSWGSTSRRLIRGYKLLLEPVLERTPAAKRREEQRRQAIQPLEILFEPEQMESFTQQINEISLEPPSAAFLEIGSGSILEPQGGAKEKAEGSKGTPKKMVSESLPVPPEEMARSQSEISLTDKAVLPKKIEPAKSNLMKRGMDVLSRQGVSWALLGLIGLAFLAKKGMKAVKTLRGKRREGRLVSQMSSTLPFAKDLEPLLNDEMGLKLELAHRYAEMGERVAARELLEEVACQGTGAEKAEAAQLLSELT